MLELSAFESEYLLLPKTLVRQVDELPQSLRSYVLESVQDHMITHVKLGPSCGIFKVSIDDAKESMEPLPYIWLIILLNNDVEVKRFEFIANHRYI